MEDLIIAAIRRRLKTTFTDLGYDSRSRLITSNPAAVSSDEMRLGFALPSLLKRIYAEVGNGGFGPGYGLIGLTNGAPDDTGRTNPAIYEEFRSSDELNWPNGLLPICHWGCAIVSCIDCTDPNFRMRIFDPNVRDKGGWSDCFFEETAAFSTWIRDWASGVSLWDRTYGEGGHINTILTERRRKS